MAVESLIEIDRHRPIRIILGYYLSNHLFFLSHLPTYRVQTNDTKNKIHQQANKPLLCIAKHLIDKLFVVVFRAPFCAVAFTIAFAFALTPRHGLAEVLNRRSGEMRQAQIQLRDERLQVESVRSQSYIDAASRGEK